MNTVGVVRAATGMVLATLGGNGLNVPLTAAFDGERILSARHIPFPKSVIASPHAATLQQFYSSGGDL